MDSNNRKKLLSLSILVSLFLLNDFGLISVQKKYLLWLLTDYAVRILAITIIIYLIKYKHSTPLEFGLVKINLEEYTRWSIILSITGILIVQVGWRFFEKILPNTHLMILPTPDNIFLHILDLTFGLALTSITEECIFRGYFYSVLKDYIKKPVIIIVLSSFVFGLVHWSLGLHAIIVASLWGILPMFVMWKTGSIFPALLAHYVTDLVAFSRIIPGNWFNF